MGEGGGVLPWKVFEGTRSQRTSTSPRDPVTILWGSMTHQYQSSWRTQSRGYQELCWLSPRLPEGYPEVDMTESSSVPTPVPGYHHELK